MKCIEVADQPNVSDELAAGISLEDTPSSFCED
jgi:hypothetical protein